MRGETEPYQSRHGEKRRVGGALLELSQPRLDIAAEIGDAEIGAEPPHLGRAPQGRGADDGARRQLGKRRRFGADEGVAHIGARQHRGDDNPLRQHRGKILHGMNGEIDRAREKRLVDLLGEEPLAAEIAQRFVGDAVA